MDLELTNVIDVSVSEAQTGVGEYNTSNVALFSHEPYANSFGVLGYQIYLSPQQVATDFGTASQTYKQAVSIFSQQPNLLANSGYLAVIPLIEAIQHIAFSGTPASGVFVLNFGGHATTNINWNDTAATIQSNIRANIVGLELATVSGSIPAGLTVNFVGYYGPASLMTVTGDTLQTGGSVAVNLTVTTTQAGETLNTAIVRTEDIIQYFGIHGTKIFSQADTLAAAATVQALNKIAFFVSRTEADVQSGGTIDLLRTGSFTKSRGLYYGASNDSDALVMMSAYVGRGLSTNFSGSNTTQTMHLKDLSGVQPDPTMTQAILNECKTAGADTYISLQGVAKVFCSGANKFFDQVYNLEWFVGAIQVAGFNYLAESSTKIPQTENGMDGLKGAYRAVCDQAVTNQYSAPGTWNSPDTFGNLSDFLANISQRGYYIFSLPISKQTQADRVARKAPLVQIALKEAGSIHSSTVIVNVNS